MNARRIIHLLLVRRTVFTLGIVEDTARRRDSFGRIDYHADSRASFIFWPSFSLQQGHCGSRSAVGIA